MMAKSKTTPVGKKVANAAEAKPEQAPAKKVASKVVEKAVVARKVGTKAPASKPATKPAPKSGPKAAPKPGATKPVAKKAAAKPVKLDKVAKPIKVEKAEKAKLKLVRDSFTMPQEDWALIQQLKDRALGFKHPVKKSELLRAGLQALAALNEDQLRAALDKLIALKPGRPKA
jgi:hypothetical protein